MREKAIRWLFILAGLYDGLLGLAFLVAARAMFDRYGVTYPNHWGYVQFPALLLVTFALMFFQVARSPAANRNLIPYGVMLKLSYSGVVFYYWLGPGVPSLWRPFAVFDLIFAVLFVWSYRALSSAR
jgi:hypothetical protein